MKQVRGNSYLFVFKKKTSSQSVHSFLEQTFMNSLDRPIYTALNNYGYSPVIDAANLYFWTKHHKRIHWTLDISRIQLRPQANQVFGSVSALFHRAALENKYTEWRLHGSIQIWKDCGQIDICHWPTQKAYFHEIQLMSWTLGAPVYSALAGRRSEATVNEVIRYSQEMTDRMGLPVAIVGHYPDSSDRFLLSSWSEYKQLMESDAFYSLDLSHLNILARQSKHIDVGLVQALFECERCLEVYMSDNDGIHDTKQMVSDYPWWWSLLEHLHPDAVIFSNGNPQDNPATV